MKAFALSFLLLFSAGVLANTTATETVWFDGTAESETINLSTEKTRTEYRTVTVPSTCYRTEYRHRCTYQPDGRPVCHTVPVTVPYPCQRRVREAYQVFDYYVDTTVNFAYELENILNGANEEFTVSVTGKDVNISVEDSKEYLILKSKSEASSSREGDLMTQVLSYKIGFVPGKIIQETLEGGVQNVRLDNGVLTFALGKHFNTKDFVQNLRIYRHRWWAPDTLLLDKDLSDGQMSVSTDGELKVVTVNLNELDVNLPSDMRVIMTTTYDTKGAEVMNPGSFDLEASANWIFN